MKKITTILTLILFFNMGVYSQLTRTNPNIVKNAIPITNTAKTGDEIINIPKGSYLKQAASDPSYGDTVGYTWYDYQTNASMQNRIFMDDAGNIQVTWTKAVDTIRDPANAFRGIGYNYFDASSSTWIPGDSNNTNFGLAEKRVGWPSIAQRSGAGEYIFAHTDRLYTNPTKGTANYTPVDIGNGALHNETGVTFYHTFGEGTSIYSTFAVGGAIGFGRSDDGGATWTISKLYVDSLVGNPFTGALIGDAVDIDAKGDTVVLLMGGTVAFSNADPNDVVLFISTDRGANWTYTTVHNFDTINAPLDVSGGYQVTSPHSDVKVLIGNDGTIHCTGSITAVLTDPGTLTSGSWYPLARGIWYWNTTMPAGFDVNDSVDYDTYVLFDSVPDLSTMGNYPSVSDDQGNYVTGSFSHPSICTDANGNLAIVYSGITCGSDNNPFDSRWRRDLFYLYSTDNGMTWSDPENMALVFNANDLTDGTVGEEAYPVTPKRSNDGMLYTLFQYDTWAGPFLNDPSPITEENKLTVAAFAFPGAVGLEDAIQKASVSLFPNPSSGYVTLTFESKMAGNVTVNVSNLIGQSVGRTESNLKKGKNNIALDLKDLSKGVYLVSLGTGDNKITQKLIIE